MAYLRSHSVVHRTHHCYSCQKHMHLQIVHIHKRRVALSRWTKYATSAATWRRNVYKVGYAGLAMGLATQPHTTQRLHTGLRPPDSASIQHNQLCRRSAAGGQPPKLQHMNKKTKYARDAKLLLLSVSIKRPSFSRDFPVFQVRPVTMKGSQRTL